MGGYNGGGSGGSAGGSGGGGGATHIATKTGLLSTLENDKSSVIIVAGGGGGYAVYGCSTSIGGNGGGHYGSPLDYGGTQEAGGPTGNQTGGSFGKGGYQSNTYHSTPGAGAGWYGGGTNSALCGAGGGSGYVGSTRLTNAYMYGYDVEPTSILWVNNYLVNKAVFLQVDEEKFNSINDAVAYIVEHKNGVGTILLLNDATIQEDSIITAGTDITFDLQEHTLTATSPIFNKGKFKVTNGTFNNVADNAIQNENELLLEDIEISAGSSGSVVYVPTNLSNTTKLTIKNSSLTDGKYGLLNESKQDIVIENTDINATDYGIYLAANNSTLEFESGNITSTNGMGIRVSNGSNTHIASGTINSRTHGIYGYCEGATVNIDTMDITSVGNEAIRFDMYNGNYNVINVLGGTYKGADYGVVAQSAHLYMSDSSIETSVSNRDRYAVYGYYYSYIYLEDCIVKAPNGSGVYINTDAIISNTKIEADASNSYGIYIYEGIVNILEGTEIVTEGTSSYGIYARGSSTLKLLEGDVRSQNVGINLVDSAKLYLSRGNIIGYQYGIQETGSGCVVQIGENTQDISIYNPFVEGSTYGVYKTNGTLNFYSGRLKGLTGPYYGAFNNIREGYELHEEADGVEIELQ